MIAAGADPFAKVDRKSAFEVAKDTEMENILNGKASAEQNNKAHEEDEVQQAQGGNQEDEVAIYSAVRLQAFARGLAVTRAIVSPEDVSEEVMSGTSDS